MFQQINAHASRKRLSLTVYISLLLALTAIAPLLVTIGSIEIFLRPALISQVSGTLEKEAQTHVQLIDAYLTERLNEVQALSQFPVIQNYLSAVTDPNATNSARTALFAAQHREVANYISWSLLDLQGNELLSYPTGSQSHGKYLILPGDLEQLQNSGKVLISDVFYDRTGNTASVDLYTRVIDNNFHPLGFVRASLGLRRIWEPIDSETRIDGPGSYASILDQHGVRIAYTNPDPSGRSHPAALFTSIAPFSSQFQQQIVDEDLYGNNTAPVKAIVDQKLINIQHDTHAPSTFQITPTSQDQPFQAAAYTSTIAPWTYVIFKPLNAVTGLADQQLLSTILIATLMLILAILVGLVIGRRITAPILRSVSSLRKNCRILKDLANEEHVVASEQPWIVEASKVGLQSAQYYTKASSAAAQRIQKISTELAQDMSHLDPTKLKEKMKEVSEAVAYINKAIHYQEETNEKLTTALHVTTQATDQLTKGAKSTDDAATQLEDIVEQLTSVVGSPESHKGSHYISSFE